MWSYVFYVFVYSMCFVILGSNTEEEFSAFNDNSDNEQSEKCAICLSKFTGQDIATPETCDHMFCLECLQEWAKV